MNRPYAASTWRWGASSGLAVALSDVALISVVEPSTSAYVWAEVLLFWTFAGVFVVGSELGLGRAHALVATLLLAAPWLILESFASGHPEHLPPLLVQSVLFGAVFTWARARAQRS